MKMEMAMTVEPARVSKGVRSSDELFAARPNRCDSMDDGSSGGTAMKTSYGSSITSGRNTERLRRTGQVEPLFDMAAGGSVMSDEDGADVKLELGVSAFSGQVPASLSRTKEVA